MTLHGEKKENCKYKKEMGNKWENEEKEEEKKSKEEERRNQRKQTKE